ncbi:DUF4214 domain-containing protein [Pigmentiphaga aceris]|uniref:DUF4214 domain-containing protein n=1 Tax=Pigmentiphaga aceris TaxID=1940612 RepID=A0A5C0ASN3_9BURK|nr:DUF4214 domain-containing protein [Pigmentiphaga aceris]QEI04656.1 DUF4214 domain-containing protein [Pigmentiphaga aceris]
MATPTSPQLAIARLYTALFNRAPDADGFAFWVRALENGASLSVLAQSMLTAPESVALYPAGQTDAQFVTSYYTSVFGRTPDPDGLAFWSAALAAQGGAGNPAARATLIQQISTIASAPLTEKPAGMSDAAYAQTVADRGRFINKTEFGVWFAAELKSNDQALAKNTFALVTDNPGSLTAATNLGNGSAVPPVTEPAPIVVPHITVADTPAAIAAKFAAYAGTAGTVDATGLGVAQLQEVVLARAKITSVTGTLLLTSGLSQPELAALVINMVNLDTIVNVDATGMSLDQLSPIGMSPSVVSVVNNLQLSLSGVSVLVVNGLLLRAVDASVVATGANAVTVGALANHAAKLIDNGITGTLVMTSDLSDTQITALLGAKTADAANVTVNAAGMNGTRLAALAGNLDKVDSITNMSFTANDPALTSNIVTALLAKAAVGSVSANVSGASADFMATVISQNALFADSGITGDITLTKSTSVADITTLLGSKTAVAANVTINALAALNQSMPGATELGLSDTQLAAVAAGIDKVDLIVRPYLKLASFDDTATIALLSKASNAIIDTGNNAGSATELSFLMSNLSKVGDKSLGGTIVLTSAQLASTGGLLGAKLYTGALTINGDATNDTIDLSSLSATQALSTSVAVNPGAGADKLIFGRVPSQVQAQTVHVGSRAETRTDPLTTDTNTDNFDTLLGVARLGTGTDAVILRFEGPTGAFGAGLEFRSAHTAVQSPSSVNVTVTAASTMADILAAANTLNPVASSSSVLVLPAPPQPDPNEGPKAYLVRATGTGGLADKTYLIVNDEVPEITLADTIVVIGGATVPVDTFFVTTVGA